LNSLGRDHAEFEGKKSATEAILTAQDGPLEGSIFNHFSRPKPSCPKWHQEMPKTNMFQEEV